MKKTVLTVLIVLLAFISAYGETNTDGEEYVVSYTINEAERVEKNYKSTDVITVDLEPADQLSLFIPANATTGYQWILKDDFEERFIQLIASEYIAPDSEMMGAGGTSVWTFKALEEGVTTLAFEYIRPWEQDVDPTIVLMIQVHIKAK